MLQIRMMKNYIFLAFLLISASCTEDAHQKDSKIMDVVSMHIEEHSISFDNEVKNCVIIPGGGCSGCIASGLLFVKNHKGAFSRTQGKNLLVFTNILSLKKLKKQLGDVTFNDLNCVVDTSNIFLMHCNENIYPIILTLDRNTLVGVTVQSPNENGLYEMEL